MITLEEALKCVGPGWAELIKQAYAQKPADVNITQVKEKFGGLRIYTDENLPAASGFDLVLGDLEDQSFKTCEECGKPGSTGRGSGYWIRTLCSEHERVVDSR